MSKNKRKKKEKDRIIKADVVNIQRKKELIYTDVLLVYYERKKDYIFYVRECVITRTISIHFFLLGDKHSQKDKKKNI